LPAVLVILTHSHYPLLFVSFLIALNEYWKHKHALEVYQRQQANYLTQLANLKPESSMPLLQLVTSVEA